MKRSTTPLSRLVFALLLFAAVFQIPVPAAQSYVCTEGVTSSIQAGPMCGCPNGMSTLNDVYKCIGGVWVYQDSYCGEPECPGSGGGGGGCSAQTWGSCPYQNGSCPAQCSCCYW